MSRSSVECICCFEDVPKRGTIKCSGIDKHRSCADCMRRHVRELLKSNSTELKCISTGSCDGHFSEQDLPKFLTKDLTDQFYKVQQRTYLQSIYGNSLVSCPFCSVEMVQDEQIDNNMIACMNIECNKESCRVCKKDYHGEGDCSRSDRRRIRKEEKETYKVIKSCPTCDTDILKDGGCSHMKCTQCKHTMCYICGIDITASPEEHGCPLYEGIEQYRLGIMPDEYEEPEIHREPYRVPPYNHRGDNRNRYMEPPVQIQQNEIIRRAPPQDLMLDYAYYIPDRPVETSNYHINKYPDRQGQRDHHDIQRREREIEDRKHVLQMELARRRMIDRRRQYEQAQYDAHHPRPQYRGIERAEASSGRHPSDSHTHSHNSYTHNTERY